MFCSNCGKKLGESARFCSRCGKSIGDAGARDSHFDNELPERSASDKTNGRDAWREANPPTDKKKRPWVPWAVAGGIVAVAALVAIALFVFNTEKPADSDDPMVGEWSTSLMGADGQMRDIVVSVYPDGRLALGGDLVEALLGSQTVAGATWEYLGYQDGCRAYSIDLGLEFELTAYVPATFDGSNFEGSWTLAIENFDGSPLEAIAAAGFYSSGDCQAFSTLTGSSLFGKWKMGDTRMASSKGGHAYQVIELLSSDGEVIGSALHTSEPEAVRFEESGMATSSVGIAGTGIDQGVSMEAKYADPTSCSAECHTPMDSYVAAYEQELGTAGSDKWGSAVSNTVSMLSVTHAALGYTCLSCHQLSDADMQVLSRNWTMGNYAFPLEERSLDDLVESRNVDQDAFCLNEACHNITREDLKQLTSGLSRNPHIGQHGDMACGECHKAHRASVMYCTQCHTDAEVPDGWVSAAEGNTLERQAMDA